jgi:hypothetical protein
MRGSVNVVSDETQRVYLRRRDGGVADKSSSSGLAVIIVHLQPCHSAPPSCSVLAFPTREGPAVSPRLSAGLLSRRLLGIALLHAFERTRRLLRADVVGIAVVLVESLGGLVVLLVPSGHLTVLALPIGMNLKQGAPEDAMHAEITDEDSVPQIAPKLEAGPELENEFIDHAIEESFSQVAR